MTRPNVDLAEAITRGVWAEAERIVAEGVDDINAPVAEDGDTILHRAAVARNPSFMRRLLKSGADPNRTNQAGDTPLMVACRSDLSVETKLLLDYGADPNYSHNGWTPLRYSAKDRNGPIVRLLLAAGAVIPQRDAPGETWASELDAFAREFN